MNESAKRMNPYRLLALSALLAIAIIAPALVTGPANASGKIPGNPKAAQGDKDKATAQARRGENLCQELQPCIGEKLMSIDTTLQNISTSVAAIAFDDPPLGTYTNVSDKCEEDSLTPIYDNTDGDDKEVSFDIKNSGSCEIELSVSRTILGESVGEPRLVPIHSTGFRKPVKVPKGMWLRTKCRGVSGRCKYLIQNVRP